MSKTNPRHIPCTAADLKRAKQAAQDFAITATSAIFLTVLCDKENADIEIIQRVWQEVNELSESIAEGYVTIPDLCRTLAEEYNITL